MITRRAALVAGLSGLGLLAAGCSGDPRAAQTFGNSWLPMTDVVTGSFVSRYRGGVPTGWAIMYPPGVRRAGLPVLVALHGRGANHTGAYLELHLNTVLASVVAAGTRPFAIASVDGGDSDYWHPRRGTDPAGMVVHEFLPLLHRHGLRTARFGLYGWSMGGYGALYLATRLGRRRVVVAIAESPAIWHHGWQSAAGAFDDAADFERHKIWGHQDALAGIAVRIDCGASDGFAPVTRDLRASIHPTPAGGIEPGGHDAQFWQSQAPAALRFAGRHLPHGR